MKRVLFICHTYNMLFASLQIVLNDLCDKNEYSVDLLLSDYSIGMDEVAKRMDGLVFFSKVLYTEVKKIYHGGGIFKKIRKTFYVFTKYEKTCKMLGLPDLNYDIVYFCNFDIISHQLYFNLRRHNERVEYHRFEEGYSTYTIYDDYTILHRFTDVYCRLIGIESLHKKTQWIHLFEPEFLIYSCPYNVVPIKKITKNDEEFIKLINYIFDYKSYLYELSKHKYIFFEECFFADKKNMINDEEIVKKISSMVGINNLIVKLHPRNTINRFEDKGISTFKCKIPWEIIQLNEELKDCTLLTVSSGAVLPTKIWFQENTKIVFLFECTNRYPHMVDENYKKYLRLIFDKYGADSVVIPTSLEEIGL